ncbi:TolB family protein [Methanosarcina horonobensis]|uniref:TolB family protein n=1 Tax=Methanosarcina horonobensis TaxID=418008 RepID=UPI0022B92B4B|nr:hypothetical protein [Methanosarcina horonobensis]
MVSTVASTTQFTKIGSGSEPTIDASNVVWTNNGNIHVYNLTTKEDVIINSSVAFHPAISGNKLVWYDESTGVPKLAVYDLKTGARSDVTEDVDSYSVPAIYGNRIVWSANSGVYMRDISTSTQTRIADGNSPDIYDDMISYESGSAEDTPQIYVYNITTKQAVDVSQYGDNLASHICDDKVIWSDFYTRLGNIRMYDIAANQQIEVTTGDDMTGYDTGGSIDIDGDRIVYLKHNDLGSTDSGDVYVYNITTEKSKQLSSGNSAQTPVVSGNVVAWSDSGSIHIMSLETQV